MTLADGHHLHRPGRFYRFFQYLSLFCFSMLGLVIAGNIFMVFVFWELVGICSYFLIGFYIERHSASTAANKAFIVNRVGDFGMIIGLMAMWGSLGTFAFGDTRDAQGNVAAPGIFSLVRPAGERLPAASARRHGALRGAGAGERDREDHAGSPDLAQPIRKSTRESPTGATGIVSALGENNVEVPDPTHYGYLLLVDRRAGNLLRLRRQKRAVSAARLAARRDGRPDARFGAGPFGDDGGGRRVSGRAVLSGVRAGGAAGHRDRRLHHAVHRGARSPSRPSTSSACWPIRRSASWAT